MTKDERNALRRIIKKHKIYQRYLELFEKNPAFSINFDELHGEIETMHVTRRTRTLRRKKNAHFTENVVDAMLDDQACRSRCTEILGQCVKITNAMEENLGNVRDFLLTEFANHLKHVGTQAERKAFVENVMKRFYEFFNQVQTLEKHARLIIEDVDKAGYTYRNLVEAIKILSRPEQVSL